MKVRGSFLIGLSVAVLLHALIVGVALVVFKPFERQATPDAAAVGSASTGAEATVPADLPVTMPTLHSDNVDEVTDAELRAAAQSIQQQAAALTDAQREAAVKKLLPAVRAIDAEQAGRIVGRLEQAYGVKGDRAYEPREGVTGNLDIDSIIPYRSEKVDQPDGTFVYRQTWVDKDGRTMIREVKSADATLTDQLLFESAGDATLGRLMQSAMRIADQISQSQASTARRGQGQP